MCIRDRHPLPAKPMRLASWTMIALTVAACGGGHDVVDSSAITCGPGAILVGDECVAVDAAPAGPPTHYELRAMPQIGADGVGLNRVIALGTRADGSPADDVVVFNTDRAGAGVYTHPQVALGALGATTNFVPCDRALPGCLGPH